MALTRRNLRYLKNLIIEYLDEPDKWTLEEGYYMSGHWYYYTTNIHKNDKTIKLVINPTLILFNTIEVYIEGVCVYKLHIIPMSYIFRSILLLRIVIWYCKVCNKNNENDSMIDDIIMDKDVIDNERYSGNIK